MSRTLSVWLRTTAWHPIASLDLLRPTGIQKSSGWQYPWICGPIHPVSNLEFRRIMGLERWLTVSDLRNYSCMSKARRTHHLPFPSQYQSHGNGNIRTGHCVQSPPRFRHTPGPILCHPTTSPDVLVRHPRPFQGTMGTVVEGPGERYEGFGDRLFEESEYGESG